MPPIVRQVRAGAGWRLTSGEEPQVNNKHTASDVLGQQPQKCAEYQAKTMMKLLISSCSQAVASCRDLKSVSLLYLRGSLTHGVAVEQEEAVRGPPVLHNQIKRMGSIKVGLFLRWRRKHQRWMCAESKTRTITEQRDGVSIP